MTKRISVVMIGVRNMARAIRFYRRILGLALRFQTTDYSEFNTRGAVLALEKRKRISASGPAFAIETKNASRDFKRLKHRGVSFSKPLGEESFGWLFIVRDSEGNSFEIVQYKRKTR